MRSERWIVFFECFSPSDKPRGIEGETLFNQHILRHPYISIKHGVGHHHVSFSSLPNITKFGGETLDFLVLHLAREPSDNALVLRLKLTNAGNQNAYRIIAKVENPVGVISNERKPSRITRRFSNFVKVFIIESLLVIDLFKYFNNLICYLFERNILYSFFMKLALISLTLTCRLKLSAVIGKNFVCILLPSFRTQHQLLICLLYNK